MSKKIWLFVIIGCLSIYADTIDKKNVDNRKVLSYILKQNCDNGNAKACCVLGVMYENKLGTKQDYKKVANLYKKSCKGGAIVKDVIF